MSGLINKVKDALTGPTQTTTTTTHTTTTGPAHSHPHNHATGPETTGAYTGATHTGAAHTGALPEGSAGPHSSRLANAADPRVDSDRDGSSHVGGQTSSHTYGTGATAPIAGNTYGNGVTGAHHNTHQHHAVGATGTTGTTTGTTEGLHGPHSSRLANALDPRVDSDRDGSTQLGGSSAGNAYGTNTYGTGATVGHGQHNHHNTVGTTGGVPEGVSGPHSSRLANAADPRVDSDRDGSSRVGGPATSHTYGTGATGHATTNTTGHSDGLGPHSSTLLNKLDPRVDSSTGMMKDSTTGTHAHSTTGGNRTHVGTNHTAKNPLDAAQVPPSVMREHIGDPQITHDDHNNRHQERHGSVAQEKYI